LDCNQTVICGKIAEISKLRYTPAGVAVADFKISHISRQMEAGLPRKVECEISAMALAQTAKTVSSMKPGATVKLTGFLAKKSRMSTQLVLHVNNVDII
jgi:primosomal replication protein N